MIKYDTQEEIEKTGEWLLRINKADCGEELMYVPSELSRWGLAPIDVVDRLDWLRRKRKAAEQDKHQAPEPAEETAPEEPAEDGTVEVEPQTEEPGEHEAPEPEPDALLGELEIPMTGVEAEPLVLDYDTYGLWEWMEPIERMVEEAMKAVFYEAPGLHTFNELASASRMLLPEPPVEQRPRRRGKLARTTLAVNIPQQRVDELVGASVGAAS